MFAAAAATATGARIAGAAVIAALGGAVPAIAGPVAGTAARTPGGGRYPPVAGAGKFSVG